MLGAKQNGSRSRGIDKQADMTKITIAFLSYANERKDGETMRRLLERILL